MRHNCLKNIIAGAIIVFMLFNLSCLALADKTAGCLQTMNDVEGPYYRPGAPFRNQIAGSDEKGERVFIKGTVLDNDCKTPVSYALIEVWQTDAEGTYYYAPDAYRLRGQMKSDDSGHYQFSTVKPGRYRILKGFRPAHIHLKVSHPDYRTIITQLYFKGDPYLWPNDACGRGCNSNDLRRIISLHDEGGIFRGTFNIIMKPYRSK